MWRFATVFAVVVFGAPASAQFETVMGRVFSADGDPAAAEVGVRWRTPIGLPGLTGATVDAGGGQDGAVVIAGDDGRFSFSPPHRGPFAIAAAAAGTRSAVRFPVMAGDACDLVLEPECRVAGTLHGLGGAAVPGVEIALRPEAASFQRMACLAYPEQRAAGRTDSDGRFSLPFERGYLRAPRWEVFAVLWAEHGGGAMSLRRPLRPIASVGDLAAHLQRGREVHGRVLDARGDPCAGARISESAHRDRTVVSDADGRFSLMTFGSVTLHVRAAGHAPAIVRIPRAEAMPWDVRLVAGFERSMRLVDAAGQPLAGCRYLASSPTDTVPFEWAARTDADGEVALRGLPEGVLLGFVEVEGRLLPVDAGLVDGDADFGEVRVGPRRTLRGVVESAARVPLPQARVVLWRAAATEVEPPYVTYTDRGGRFEFGAVPAGDLVVAVDAGGHGVTSRAVAAADAARHQRLRLVEGAAIEGVVLDARGHPVAGAWVALHRAGGQAAALPPSPSLTTTTVCTHSDADGHFRFVGLPQDDATWGLVCHWLRDGVLGGGGVSQLEAGSTGVIVATRAQVQ